MIGLSLIWRTYSFYSSLFCVLCIWYWRPNTHSFRWFTRLIFSLSDPLLFSGQVKLFNIMFMWSFLIVSMDNVDILMSHATSVHRVTNNACEYSLVWWCYYVLWVDYQLLHICCIFNSLHRCSHWGLIVFSLLICFSYAVTKFISIYCSFIFIRWIPIFVVLIGTCTKKKRNIFSTRNAHITIYFIGKYQNDEMKSQGTSHFLPIHEYWSQRKYVKPQ